MGIMKKYVIKCHKCNKDVVLDVKTSKVGHMEFIDDMCISKNSSCKCLKCGSSIKDLQILFRQLIELNKNRDFIIKDLDENN